MDKIQRQAEITCMNKIVFKKYKNAYKYSKNINRLHKGRLQSVYKCQVGNHYHLTTGEAITKSKIKLKKTCNYTGIDETQKINKNIKKKNSLIIDKDILKERLKEVEEANKKLLEINLDLKATNIKTRKRYFLKDWVTRILNI
jgi:hypothetical protein